MERIWLAHYPAGVPADIGDQLARWPSLAHLFDDCCTRYADNLAFTSLGVSLHYRALHGEARAFAAWLQQQGVGRGARVALMMPNLLQYPVCLFGTWMAGAAIVNVNPMYTASELHHQLVDSGAQTIVVAEPFTQTLQQAIEGTAVERVIVTAFGDLLGAVRGALVNWTARRRLNTPVVHDFGPQWPTHHLHAVLAAGRALPLAPVTLGGEDLAALQYTGGTTGVAKGAMLSHGNLVANVCQAVSWVRPFCQGEAECVVTALPLYHIFALTANCLSFVMLGARNLLIIDPRDVRSLVRSLQRTPFTALTGVNTLFRALLDQPAFCRLDFSRLSLTFGGGMAVQETVAQHWQQVTGKPIVQAYGLTETSPAVTINPLDQPSFSTSVGLPIPATEVAIRADNRTLPIGESGEICIKGPQVMSGYWQRPEETAATFDADGYLMSGDIGKMDERGFVYLLDRKKDMILVSGFNVYPNEVEAAAVTHPGVREAAAVGVPDEHSGQAVALYVIRRDPKLTEAALIAHCRTLLTGYKVPRHVIFRDTLPRTNVGKILRRALRDEDPAARRVDTTQ